MVEPVRPKIEILQGGREVVYRKLKLWKIKIEVGEGGGKVVNMLIELTSQTKEDEGEGKMVKRVVK